MNYPLIVWFRIARYIAISLAVLLVLPVMVATASAATTNKTNDKAASNDITNAVSQSYNADAKVQIGMAVELKPKDPSTVVPLKNNEVPNMLGIVVPANQANIVITPAKVTQQQVLVATSGKFDLLVSNQQGPIRPGDYVTISAIDGIGMKATETETQVVGQATGTFDGKANVIGSTELKDNKGSSRKVTLGRVQIEIRISHNPLYQESPDYVPSVLGRVASGVANKPVSAARIYLSVAILFIISVLVGNILYSGIRSGMIAVGRNPLSKKSIMRSLIETVIAGLIIFVVGVFAVYLLLKL
jgi:hypothetical protein